jgi:chromatin remodeling complex protein RSC6
MMEDYLIRNLQFHLNEALNYVSQKPNSRLFPIQNELKSIYSKITELIQTDSASISVQNIRNDQVSKSKFTVQPPPTPVYPNGFKNQSEAPVLTHVSSVKKNFANRNSIVSQFEEEEDTMELSSARQNEPFNELAALFAKDADDDIASINPFNWDYWKKQVRLFEDLNSASSAATNRRRLRRSSTTSLTEDASPTSAAPATVVALSPTFAPAAVTSSNTNNNTSVPISSSNEVSNEPQIVQSSPRTKTLHMNASRKLKRKPEDIINAANKKRRTDEESDEAADYSNRSPRGRKSKVSATSSNKRDGKRKKNKETQKRMKEAYDVVKAVKPPLAKFIGKPTATKREALSVVWNYIHEHGLQSNPKNKNQIIFDETLKKALSTNDNQIHLAAMLSSYVYRQFYKDDDVPVNVEVEEEASEEEYGRARLNSSRTEKRTPASQIRGISYTSSTTTPSPSYSTPAASPIETPSSTASSSSVSQRPKKLAEVPHLVKTSAAQEFFQTNIISPGDARKKVWDYVHSHNLLDQTNKNIIHMDHVLKNAFGQNSDTITAVPGIAALCRTVLQQIRENSENSNRTNIFSSDKQSEAILNGLLALQSADKRMY